MRLTIKANMKSAIILTLFFCVNMGSANATSELRFNQTESTISFDRGKKRKKKINKKRKRKCGKWAKKSYAG